MTTTPTPPFDARATAAIDLLHRTGASSFQIRYTDDEPPVVWNAVAAYQRAGTVTHEVAAALHPIAAVRRLVEEVVDGGTCAHCKRPTALMWDDLDGIADLLDGCCLVRYHDPITPGGHGSFVGCWAPRS